MNNNYANQGSLTKKVGKKKDLFEVFCDPAGIRTQGPYIKSVLLYQLSYGINRF